ncbi:HTH-type transcriptional activator Btr [compost metagenome]
MPELPVHIYRDMLDEDFPFKIEIRTPSRMREWPHAHEYLQLCYMLSGSCLHWTNGRSYLLTKGDLFSIPPFQEHRLNAIDNKDFVLAQVDFLPHAVNESLRDLKEMQNFVDFAYIRPLISRDDLIPKLPLPNVVQARVEQLLTAILEEWKEREEGYRLAIKAELLRLLVITGRQYARYSEAEGEQENKHVAVQREAFHEAIHYMKTHYDEDLQLEGVAAMALMSPSYFSSMLRLATGKSYIELLSSVRIGAAMELLRSTGLSVTAIASRVGYNHIGHFNRMFKKHTEMTPRAFRRADS